jgi:hypothetical protein
MVDVRRPATIAVCGWAAISIATSRKHTVSWALHRVSHIPVLGPVLVVGLAAYGVWHWFVEQGNGCPACHVRRQFSLSS